MIIKHGRHKKFTKCAEVCGLFFLVCAFGMLISLYKRVWRHNLLAYTKVLIGRWHQTDFRSTLIPFFSRLHQLIWRKKRWTFCSRLQGKCSLFSRFKWWASCRADDRKHGSSRVLGSSQNLILTLTLTLNLSQTKLKPKIHDPPPPPKKKKKKKKKAWARYPTWNENTEMKCRI